MDGKLEGMPAARAEKERRSIGRGARSVGGDQQVGAQETILVLHAKLAQSGGADFLSHLDENLRVEAEAPALGDDRGECGDVDAVLTLVVGGSAAVEALSLHRQPPGRET